MRTPPPPTKADQPRQRVHNAPIKLWFRLAQPRQRIDSSHAARRYLKGIFFRDPQLTEVQEELRLARQKNNALERKLGEQQKLNVNNNKGECSANFAGKRQAGNADTILSQNAKLAERVTKSNQVWKASYENQRVLHWEQKSKASELNRALGSAKSEIRPLTVQNSKLCGLVTDAQCRADHLRAGSKSTNKKLHDFDSVIAALGAGLEVARTENELSSSVITRLTSECESLQSELDSHSDLFSERMLGVQEEVSSSLRQLDATMEELNSTKEKLELMTAPKKGRPTYRATHEDLCCRWGGMTTGAKRQAMWRHCDDIEQSLVGGGLGDWSPAALAKVLFKKGLVPALMSTVPFARQQLELVVNLGDILRSEWNADLAVHSIADCELSGEQYQKLRLAFCKSYNERRGWGEKLWYQCPSSGQKIWMPEPFVAQHAWKADMKAKLAPHDLVLSRNGRVSQRSYTDTLSRCMKRDAHLLKSEFTQAHPAQPVYGIDHASISRVREFSHAGVSRAPMYVQGSPAMSELKLATLMVGNFHDDGAGLSRMMGPQEAFESESGLCMPAVPGLAAELNQAYNSKCILIDDQVIPSDPAVCLDFAAIRGMCKVRGKAAAVCACKSQKMLQSYPGGGGIPDLPIGDTIEDYRVAEGIAESQCSWGSAKMAAPSLRDATHTPPSDWNPAVSGPWKCSWCDVCVFNCWEEHAVAVVELKALKVRAGTNKDAKTEYDNIISSHADCHGDRLLYDLPVFDACDTKNICD